MSGIHTPLILIEVVLVFGGALLFGWWQLRSVARDQQRTREERARAEAAEAAEATKSAGSAQPDPVPLSPGSRAADEPRT